MAITIRNKALEAEIKAIGARLNKGPTDVLRTLVEQHAKLEAERQSVEEDALLAKRSAAMKTLMDEVRALITDEDRDLMQRNMDEMYDENGLPR